MGNFVDISKPGTVRIRRAERDARKEVSIFVTMAPNLTEPFCAAGIAKENIACARETYFFNLPAPPSQLLDTFRYFYGPTMNAFAAAEANGRAGDLLRELQELFESQNHSGSKHVTSIPATFLRVTVTRP